MVRSGGADAAVPGQRLEQVNGNALVGQVRQKCPAAAVAAGASSSTLAASFSIVYSLKILVGSKC